VDLTPAGLRWRSGIEPAIRGERAMSVAKIIEVNASSKTSMEDAVKVGLKKTSETVKNIKGAWVNEIKVVTDDGGNVQEWRVNLRISFVVE
jgi:flavin-binding protein dodecin